MTTFAVRFIRCGMILLVSLTLLQTAEGQRTEGDRRGRTGGRGEAEGSPRGAAAQPARGGPESGMRGGPPGGGPPGGGPPGGGPPGGGMWGGGPPGGGPPGGGPPGGGMWGGGPPGGGPPGGGMWGGGGGAGNAMAFLSRMDTNGNGLLDPEETQGPARMFLERTGLDLSRPIPLDQVARSFEEMRNRRMEEMGRGGRERGEGPPREGGGDRAGGGRGERGEEGPQLRDVQPLVPGFGEPDLFDPVPGFGDLGERFAVKIEDQDMQEAQRTLARYDANNDGVLDADEIRNARWGEDPLLTDRNRDGRLTLTELALRYAMRRVENEGGSSGARTAGQATRGRQSAAPQRDQGGDRGGREAREGGRGGEERGGQGRERWFTRREEGGDGNAPPRGASPSAPASNGRTSYRMLSSAERLATLQGLPEWFARLDTNGDGQVSMAEYSANWSDEVVTDFMQFDLNGDGIITAPECLRAVEGGAVQGVSSSVASRSSNGERRSDRGESSRGNDERTSASPRGSSTASAARSAAPATGGDDESRRYVEWAVKFMARYDTNKDGVLTEDEWTKMPKDYSAADADGDGRITPAELAKFSQQ